MTTTTAEEVKSKSKSKSLRALIVTLLIAVILVLILSKELDQVRHFIARGGWVGLLFSLGIYALLGLSPIPSEPFTILISTIYGPLPATLVATLGNLFAALMEGYIGLKIGDVVSYEKQRQRLPLGLGKFPVESPVFLIFARMLPGYGPKFVSVISGMHRVPVWRYIWTTLLANILGAAIVAYGGFEILQLNLW